MIHIYWGKRWENKSRHSKKYSFPKILSMTANMLFLDRMLQLKSHVMLGASTPLSGLHCELSGGSNVFLNVFFLNVFFLNTSDNGLFSEYCKQVYVNSKRTRQGQNWPTSMPSNACGRAIWRAIWVGLVVQLSSGLRSTLSAPQIKTLSNWIPYGNFFCEKVTIGD